MKAVILAAGMGIRLRPMTESLPKGLIEVNGKTLLERSLENLKENGIKEVIIVTGFYAGSIRDKFGHNYQGLQLKYVHSTEYESTGSMYSLSLLQGLVDDDIVVLESDLLYDKKAIQTILESPYPNVILVADLLNSGDDVYICADENNKLINLGKNISEEEKQKACGALVGITKYSKEYLPILFAQAEQDYAQNEKQYHYEECVFSTTKLGHVVHTQFCNDLNWIEIDNEDDLKRAKEEIYPKIKKEKISPATDRLNFPSIQRNILLNPGPATTTDTVKFAQVVPDICPREKEFGELMHSISNDLIQIAGGDEQYACVLFGGSGTAAMDATINSVVPSGKKILVINNGAYGERIAKIARAYQIECIELKFEWDSLPDLHLIEEQLKLDSEIVCVAMIHHETTTGLLNPIKEVGKIVKNYNKLFIVDTISSFAGVPLNINDFNIDFMMSTSNKCIQGMAGVCFVICKKTELEKIQHYPRRSFYLSLYDQYEYFINKNQMRFTPPVQTLYALKKAIEEFLVEGYQNRVVRYTKNWQILREGIKEIGLKILTKREEESKILITILYPTSPNFDFNQLHNKLYTKGFTIYPGKIGKMNSFRLSVMGDINEKDIISFLDNLKDILQEMDVTLN